MQPPDAGAVSATLSVTAADGSTRWEHSQAVRAALDGELLGLIQLGLHVLHLAVQSLPTLLGELGSLLLGSELICQPVIGPYSK